MVRPRSTRWLIFPTSAVFSTISAAAATVLILLGAGILLLHSNSAGAPNLGAVAVEQQTNSQIAVLPTEMPPLSEKTAEHQQREADETAAAANTVDVLPSPPAVANGSTIPDNSVASPMQPPQATNEEQPAPVTSDGVGSAESTGGEETGQGQAAQSAAPADSTMLYAATMVPPSVLPFAPGAADTAAQTGASAQQENNPQSSAAAEILSDQAVMTITGAAGFGTDNQDTFGLLTATMIVEQFAAILPTGTSTPSPTLAPTMTVTPNPTATPTPTSMPTQIPPAPSVQIAPVDLLTWGALIIGALLLVVAVITTIVRRRG
jgi:hypothetical protein